MMTAAKADIWPRCARVSDEPERSLMVAEVGQLGVVPVMVAGVESPWALVATTVT